VANVTNEATAAVLVVKPWSGHRVGATLVLQLERARHFERMGVLRVLAPQAADPLPATQDNGKTIKSRRGTNGS
jgi:hypothetical protein